MSQDGFDMGMEAKPDLMILHGGYGMVDEGWLDQLLAAGTLPPGHGASCS